MVKVRMAALAACCVPLLAFGGATAHAETIFDAMAKAYANNPDLNAARAGLRAVDEGVAIAKAGMRPQINGFLQGTKNRIGNLGLRESTLVPATVDPTTGLPTSYLAGDDYTTASAGLTITQQIFDGFQTLNNVKAAESNVFATRAQVKAREIQILLAAAQTYADIARDQQILAIRKQNIAFLQEQVNAANSRLQVGEGTKTDVSLAQAQLAQSRALLAAADFQLKRSRAVYTQIVGDAPKGVSQPKPVSKLLPKSIDSAVAVGLREHPSVIASEYAIDAAGFQVKSAEGAMLPGVVVQGSIQRNTGDSRFSSFQTYTSSSLTARLNVPIYQGGAEHAQIRQAKERLGEQRILLDSARLEVQQTIVTAMAQYEAAQAVISANNAQLSAAQQALDGVIEERNVGQATTLDVLTAQSNVLNARESLATSQHDAVVASFSVVAAMGHLTVDTVNLNVAVYDPKDHYDKTKDKWWGLRTVDGR